MSERASEFSALETDEADNASLYSDLEHWTNQGAVQDSSGDVFSSSKSSLTIQLNMFFVNFPSLLKEETIEIFFCS